MPTKCIRNDFANRLIIKLSWIIQSSVFLPLLHANLFWHGVSVMKICSCRIHFIKVLHIKMEMEVSWRIRWLVLIPAPGAPWEGPLPHRGWAGGDNWRGARDLPQQAGQQFLKCSFHLLEASCLRRLNLFLSSWNLLIFKAFSALIITTRVKS